MSEVPAFPAKEKPDGSSILAGTASTSGSLESQSSDRALPNPVAPGNTIRTA
jgi:hypothetical protein